MAAQPARRSRLSMFALIQDGILTPGEKVLTFDYMGMHCEADLLSDGWIQWQGQKFSSPYAWASQCKNDVNPNHKSGIGWGHIRYRGVKLSQYKSMYLKKYQLSPSVESQELPAPIEGMALGFQQHQKIPVKRGRKRKNLLSGEQEHIAFTAPTVLPNGPTAAAGGGGGPVPGGGGLMTVTQQVQDASGSSGATAAAVLVQQGEGGATSLALIPQQATPTIAMAAPTPVPVVPTPTLFQCTAFETLGLKQPFSVSISSNVLMIMDFHCHLSAGEVSGYLGGRYNPVSKSLEVCQAFPCRCDETDTEQCSASEKKIQKSMQAKDFQVVGWYHSHPVSEPKPSQNDILSQKKYQDAVRTEDMSAEPCIGVIVSPNHGGKLQEMVSQFEVFWVLMLQQNGLQASPMKMQYSTDWQQYLTQDVVDEMNAIAAFYKPRQSCPTFKGIWKGDSLFINKFRKSLSEVQPKFPEENSDLTFMTYIDQLLLSNTQTYMQPSQS